MVDVLNPILEQEIQGQGVFVSTFTHALDPKKRLTIPSGWRAQVGDPKSLYVLPDVNHKCLRVFPAAEMTRRLDKIRDTSLSDQKARQFARVIGSRADLVSWDAQGRIRIKDELLSFAGVVDRVILVGTFDTFEVWSPDHLEGAGGLSDEQLREAARYVGF